MIVENFKLEDYIMKEKLKLYLISQNKVTGYDTFDSAVVVAKNGKEAADIHPYGFLDDTFLDKRESVWATDAADVVVEYLGEFKGIGPSGIVICASFNAG